MAPHFTSIYATVKLQAACNTEIFLTQISPPAFNTTPTVLILIAINVAVHLLRMLLPGQWDAMIGFVGAFSPPLWLSIVMGEGNQWGYILLLSPIFYAFLHADLLHLVINMGFLLAFGTAVERRLGQGPFLALYILCAVCGACASLAVYFAIFEQTFMVGASGAISGLFGAALRISTRKTWTAVAAFIAINLVIGYTGLPSMGQVRAVAWEGHIGGFLAGYLLFSLFDVRTRRLTPRI